MRTVLALAALVTTTTGCFTGHLLDAARRRERAVAVREAWIDRTSLVLVWDALVTTDLGEPRGRATRAGAIPLDALTRPLAADAVPVEERDRAAPMPPQAVQLPLRYTVRPDAACAESPEDPEAVVLVPAEDVTSSALVVRHGDQCLGPLPLAGLASSSIAAWAWPLLPSALLLDAAVVPPLLFFAPAVITMGE